MTTTKKTPRTKTNYTVTGFRRRTTNTPQITPKVGDMFEVDYWPNVYVFRVGKVEKARPGIDDMDGDGVAISHYFRLDDDFNGAFWQWVELPAHYDAVRITTADYIARRRANR